MHSTTLVGLCVALGRLLYRRPPRPLSTSTTTNAHHDDSTTTNVLFGGLCLGVCDWGFAPSVRSALIHFPFSFKARRCLRRRAPAVLLVVVVLVLLVVVVLKGCFVLVVVLAGGARRTRMMSAPRSRVPGWATVWGGQGVESPLGSSRCLRPSTTRRHRLSCRDVTTCPRMIRHACARRQGRETRRGFTES